MPVQGTSFHWPGFQLLYIAIHCSSLSEVLTFSVPLKGVTHISVLVKGNKIALYCRRVGLQLCGEKPSASGRVKQVDGRELGA